MRLNVGGSESTALVALSLGGCQLTFLEIVAEIVHLSSDSRYEEVTSCFDQLSPDIAKISALWEGRRKLGM